MHSIKLFGHYDSGHVYKVMLLLEIAALDYDYEHVDIWTDRNNRQAQFLEHSRNAEVPCLLLDDQAYIQSNLILHKLASVFNVYGGESPQRLIKALDWQFWEANRLGMCLPQLRYANRFAPREFNPQSLAFLNSRFDQDIALLAGHLSDGREFILDNTPSIADFSLCGYLYWADEAGVELPDLVNRWLDRVSKLPRWRPPYEMMRRREFEPA